MADQIPGMPDESKKSKIIRLLNLELSVQAIYFVKTRKVICTGGYVEKVGKWLGAIIHAETHKIVIHTKPIFDNKSQAIEFMEELLDQARQTKL